MNRYQQNPYSLEQWKQYQMQQQYQLHQMQQAQQAQQQGYTKKSGCNCSKKKNYPNQ